MIAKVAVRAAGLVLVALMELPAAGQQGLLPPVFLEMPMESASDVRFVLRTDQLQASYAKERIELRADAGTIQLTFPGESQRVHVAPFKSRPGRFNFITGSDPAQWSSDVKLWSGVVYQGLYPGIDMRWRVEDAKVKSEFVVRPDADVHAIRLRYTGMAAISIEPSGDLLLHTANGDFREKAPEAYAIQGGSRIPVPARFRREGPGEVGFEVGRYDHRMTLVVDPALSYSTFLGGAGHSSATSIAVDGTGNIYVAGWTEAIDFPVTAGPMRGDGVDAFVAKFSATNALVYCTFIGGAGDDRVAGIAVDGSGNAVVAGMTTSPNLPYMNGVQTVLRGTRDAFVAKLNAAGNALLFDTYFGGTGSDDATAVALDGAGGIYVGGNTSSTDFPAVNAFQSVKAGQQDGYVFKLDSTGRTILYSTFLGGSNADSVTAIAVDPAGSAYVAGSTVSSNFPVAGALRGTIPGQQSGFVTKLSPNGKTLSYSTYLGGSGGTFATPEVATGIAVDTLGSAYITGATSSTDFPTVNAYQGSVDGGTHGFVSKLNAAGSGLVYSTYLAGSGRDWPTGIRVSGSGAAYKCGYTSSVDFPIGNAIQPANAGLYDAFAVELAAGGGLVFGSYLGGKSIDSANAIAVTSSGGIVLAGHTMSTDFPTVAAFQRWNTSSYSAFVSRISLSGMSVRGDFDGNSVPDIFVQNTDTSMALWYVGGTQNNQVLSSSAVSGALPGWSAVNVADLNGDGVPDVILQNDATRQIAAWFMGGPQGNQIQSFHWIANPGAAGWSVASMTDMNGDGRPDVILQKDVTHELAVWYLGGPLGTQIQGFAWLLNPGSPTWTVIGMADLDGNGYADLIIQSTSGFIGAWYMGAPGTPIQGFQWIANPALPGWSVIGLADMNHDSKPDLLLQNTSTYQIAVWYMGGSFGNAIQGFSWIATPSAAGWRGIGPH